MKFDLPLFLKELDYFGDPIPSFNLRGETEVKTSIGACLSIIVSICTLAFSLIKLEHLVTRKNPALVMNEVPNEQGTIFETR